MLEWMRHNLEEGSIFPDAEERIMTADQVIVFKTGSPADRGVLLWTLLKHKGIDSELILTGDTAVVHAGQVWCDMKTIQLTEPVENPEMVIGL